MKYLLVVVCAIALWGAAAPLDPALRKARDLQDRPALAQLSADARAAADKAPKDAGAQYRYALALSIQAEVALELKDKSGAEKSATAGVKAIDAAIAINPGDAEYQRVLATLCGQVIPANIFAGFSYGKRAKEAIDKAKQMDPQSPRVWIADGVGNYYLPASFGGGPDAALRSFKRALELDPKNAEAWLWQGLALRKKQQNADARASFEKALELDSDRVWVKQQLEKTPAK